MPAFDWRLLDDATITSLYLYGTTPAPVNYDDRVRNTNAPPIPPLQLDMYSYISSGPGGYACPLTPLVDRLFAGDRLGMSDDGPYTVAELRQNYISSATTPANVEGLTKEFN